MLGQNVIEYSGGTALAETHVTAYHRLAADDGDRDTVIGGRYLDRMDKREALGGTSTGWTSAKPIGESRSAQCSTTGIRTLAGRSIGHRA